MSCSKAASSQLRQYAVLAGSLKGNLSVPHRKIPIEQAARSSKVRTILPPDISKRGFCNHSSPTFSSQTSTWSEASSSSTSRSRKFDTEFDSNLLLLGGAALLLTTTTGLLPNFLVPEKRKTVKCEETSRPVQQEPSFKIGLPVSNSGVAIDSGLGSKEIIETDGKNTYNRRPQVESIWIRKLGETSDYVIHEYTDKVVYIYKTKTKWLIYQWLAWVSFITCWMASAAIPFILLWNLIGGFKTLNRFSNENGCGNAGNNSGTKPGSRSDKRSASNWQAVSIDKLFLELMLASLRLPTQNGLTDDQRRMLRNDCGNLSSTILILSAYVLGLPLADQVMKQVFRMPYSTADQQRRPTPTTAQLAALTTQKSIDKSQSGKLSSIAEFWRMPEAYCMAYARCMLEWLPSIEIVVQKPRSIGKPLNSQPLLLVHPHGYFSVGLNLFGMHCQMQSCYHHNTAVALSCLKATRKHPHGPDDKPPSHMKYMDVTNADLKGSGKEDHDANKRKLEGLYRKTAANMISVPNDPSMPIAWQELAMLSSLADSLYSYKPPHTQLLVAPFLTNIGLPIQIFSRLMGVEIVPARASAFKGLISTSSKQDDSSADGGDANGGETSLRKHLTPLGLVPGGFQEISYAPAKQETIFMQERKGCIKHALRNGLTLVPVYCYGERQTYWTFNVLENLFGGVSTEPGRFLQMLVNRNDIPATLACSSWFPAPNRIGMKVLCGEPMELPRIEEPTNDDVNFWHGVYVDVLKELVDSEVCEKLVVV